MFSKLLIATLFSAVAADLPAWVDEDWTLMPVEPLVGSLSPFTLGHFGVPSETWATENLEGPVDLPTLVPELYMSWVGPAPGVVNYTFEKYDFDTCEIPADAGGAFNISETEWIYLPAARTNIHAIWIDQATIEMSDVWNSSTTTIDGYGEIKICVNAKISFDDIQISHLKTKITLRIYTVEGFVLDTQSLQCWTDEVEVSDSVETDYLDDPFICNSTLMEVDPPEDGYLPGENFCFCLEADEMAQDDVFVYDVLNALVSAEDSGISYSVDFAANETHPLINYVCYPDEEICRVCVLLVEELWPFEECEPHDCPGSAPDCDPKESCPDAGVDVSGEVVIGFGESNPDAGDRKLRSERKLQEAGSFAIEAAFTPKTSKPSKKVINSCARSIVDGAKCKMSRVSKLAKKCDFDAFKAAAKAEKKAAISKAKSILKRKC